jgi:tripartite-type tricarboxylate transporter receptor subunit TctC
MTNPQRALPVVLFAGFMLAAASVLAQSPEQFYKGKSVDMFVGSPPGGGYDGYGRLIARHIGKHIPGTPTVIVRNMPGAGGLTMINNLYHQAARDGTAMAIVHNNLTVEKLLGNPNARFDAEKFNWIGSANKLVNVCVAWHTVPLKTAEDLRSREWLVGGTGPRDSTVQQANVFIVLGGAKLRVVKGYPSATSTILALERGELEVACGIGWDSIKSSTGYLQSGQIKPVMQLGYEKHPELMDVPFIYDMLLDPNMKEVLDFLTIRLYIGRAFAAPPEVPADRVAALRAAFAAAVKDPELQEEARKRQMDLLPASGEDIQKEVTKLAGTSPRIVEIANKVLLNEINIFDAKLNWFEPKGVTLTAIERGGRFIAFTDGGKAVKADTEGGKITIAGAEAKAADLKAGMSCDLSYLGNGDMARTVNCK